jgi:predicted ATPase
VAATLAQALGLGATQADPLAGVKLHLRDQHLLLVLDNFEHLLEAAPLVAEVLAAAPGVKTLATSRVALRLSPEYVFEVPPLDQTAAIDLFAVRAAAVKPGFALTPENRDTVAALCRRLDRLPLALELAAARLRLFSPQALLARLQVGSAAARGALDVLAEGPRDLPARQRTLRATVAWSYALLTPGQQHLLRHLSVFAGGCSLDAARAVAGHPLAFDADLQTLLDSSLVQPREGPDGEPRLSLLEMVREYAAEQLAACGEAEAARSQHVAYYLEFVRGSAPEVMRRAGSPFRLEPLAEGITWVRRLEPEYDNLRVALAWGLGDGRVPATETELATWLLGLWYYRGPWPEAVYWLERALARPEGAGQPLTRARLLISLARFVGPVRDVGRAVEAAQEALGTFHALENEPGIAISLWILTDAELERNHLAAARRHGEEWLALARQLRNAGDVRAALVYLGDIALCQKDFARAAALFDESDESVAVALGAVPPAEARVLTLERCELACWLGDYDRAAAMGAGDLAVTRAMRFTHGTATALHNLGDIALFRGDAGQAKAHFTEGLRLFGEIGNRQRAVWCLGGLAATEASAVDVARAVTLWAAAEAIHAAIGSPRPALRVEDYRQRLEAARSQLDERAVAIAAAPGRAMTFEQAVAYALQGVPSSP